jgi:hypothetical protein
MKMFSKKFYKNNCSHEGRDRHYHYNHSESEGKPSILVIMYVKTINTDLIVFIGNVVICSTSKAILQKKKPLQVGRGGFVFTQK